MKSINQPINQPINQSNLILGISKSDQILGSSHVATRSLEQARAFTFVVLLTPLMSPQDSKCRLIGLIEIARLNLQQHVWPLQHAEVSRASDDGFDTQVHTWHTAADYIVNGVSAVLIHLHKSAVLQATLSIYSVNYIEQDTIRKTTGMFRGHCVHHE